MKNKKEKGTTAVSKQQSLDESEDFENSINPLDMLEVSPVNSICSPHLNDDVKIVVFEKPPFRCPECYVAFPEYPSFRYHVIIRHEKDPCVLCDLCGVPCSSEESQSAHKTEAHAPNSEGTTPSKKRKRSSALKQGNQILRVKKQKKTKEEEEEEEEEEEDSETNEQEDEEQEQDTKDTKEIKRGRKKKRKSSRGAKGGEVEYFDSDSDFAPDEKELGKDFAVTVLPKTYNLRKSLPQKRILLPPDDSDEEEEEKEAEEETENFEDAIVDKNTLKCLDCEKTFHSERGLEIHRIAKHDYEPSKVKAKCSSCGKEFGSFSVYRRHDSQQCKVDSEENNSKSPRKRKS